MKKIAFHFINLIKWMNPFHIETIRKKNIFGFVKYSWNSFTTNCNLCNFVPILTIPSVSFLQLFWGRQGPSIAPALGSTVQYMYKIHPNTIQRRRRNFSQLYSKVNYFFPFAFDTTWQTSCNGIILFCDGLNIGSHLPCAVKEALAGAAAFSRTIWIKPKSRGALPIHLALPPIITAKKKHNTS